MAAEKTAPPALRAKGLDERDPSRLTYSGPDESGGTTVRRASSDGAAAEKSTATRRERREAARNTVKPVKRGAKSKRRK